MAEPEGNVSVVIDRDACIGAGMCVAYAPETFTQDAEAKSTLLQPPGDSPDRIRIAVEACPMGALSLVTQEQGA